MLRLLLILAFVSLPAVAGKDEAIAHFRAGRYVQVAAELEELASGGDARAMVTLGNMYHAGRFGSVDFARAYDWWYRAWQAGDADALVNLGVLYRDGEGVSQNLEIAYAIFVLVHMQGLGSDDTQVRNGGNLTRTVDRIDAERIRTALCFSGEYVFRYIAARGGKVAPTAPGEVRLRDRDWWLEGELPEFTCT